MGNLGQTLPFGWSQTMKKLFRVIAAIIRESLWVAIAIACVFGGIMGYRYLGDNREVVELAAVERPVALVETALIEPFNMPLPVRAEGFVQPYRQISLSTSTGGRIADLHPAVISLGEFSAGDILVQLDDSAERAVLLQTEANMAATQARLDLVLSQLDRTTSLRERGVASQQALDQLLSQEAELTASLNSLRAARQSAEIALDNKRVIAPFDGAVLSKDQEVGSVVGSGQSIAEIYTQDRMEVLIPVREADAALIPGLFQDGAAKARVTVQFAGQVYEWDASVARVDPALDRRTRTLSVSVALDNIHQPRLLNDQALANGTPPALINAFAKVEIDGITQPDTYAIPSTALRSGNQIWVFDPAQDDLGSLLALEARPLHVDGETTYVSVKGWPEGKRLISTSLAAASPGMQLRDISNVQMAGATSPAVSE
jgi:RND family efflux transporter MFP subunit